MKRKLKKILLIVLSVIIVIVVAIALTISPITRNYIEKHSKEMVGRKILIKDLHLNIFTGRLEMDSIRMYEKNDKELFASVDTFLIKISLFKLISSRIEVKELKVIAPYTVIQQNGSHFNYDDLLPKEDTIKAPKKKSSFPKSVVITNIIIRSGRLIYSDLQLKNTIRMNELGVTIPQLSFDQGNTNAGIHLKIGKNGTLNSHLTLNMKTNEYRLNLDLVNLAADIITPYVKAYYNIGKLDGQVNTKLQFVGNMNHIMDFKISGTGSCTRLNVTNMLGDPVASANYAEIKITKIYLPTSTYLFDYIHASNAILSFILTPKTNNFSVLLKPEDKNAPHASTSEPMTFKVKDLHLTESQVNYTDKTLHAPFSLPVKKIDFTAQDFDMNGTNQIRTKAAFPEGGIMDFSWKGNMNDLSNQQIIVNIQNLSLRLFSPYCLNYTAFPIINGNLNFISKNNILHNNIESLNMLDVYKMRVGDKNKKLKAEYKVPLKLALYILKDKDEKIKFDVPVKGSTKDPQFSYRKIIFKTLVNLMVKVAVSPVKFLANNLGLKSDNLEAFVIEPLQTGFTAKQYSELNDLANITKAKPELTLTLFQYVNIKEELPLLAMYKTKERFLLSQPYTDNKMQISYEEVQALKNNDAQFVAYVDTLVKKHGNNLGDVSLQEKINSLYTPDSLKAEFQNKLETRNQLLKSYLITTGGIPEKNIVVATAESTTLEAYSEQPKYKIDMTLPGAEKTEE